MSSEPSGNNALRRLSRPSIVGRSFGPTSSVRNMSGSSGSSGRRRDDSDSGSADSTGSQPDPRPDAAPRSRRGSSLSAADNPADTDPGTEGAGGASPKPTKKRPPAAPRRAPGAPSRQPSSAPAAPSSPRKAPPSLGATSNPLSTVAEGSVSDWQGSSAPKQRKSTAGAAGSKRGPARSSQRQSRRASSARTSSMLPGRARQSNGPVNSPEHMAKSAALKKAEREIMKKRLKRRFFFMLWYGKAFTTAQVWALRALMAFVMLSVCSICLETMSTGGDFNIQAPVLQSNNPADVDYTQDRALLDGLITLEIIVVIVSMVEYALRVWVCTIPKFYARAYDEMDFWFRWGCCLRTCLYGEQTALMGAQDESAARKLLADKRTEQSTPLVELPGMARGSAAARSKFELSEEELAARKRPPDMDFASRLQRNRSRMPTKAELRSLRNKSRIMFVLSLSSLLDLASMAPLLLWAVTGGAFDIFSVGSDNVLAATCRLLRLLRLCKFARYVSGIRNLTAVTVEKRAEMATGFLLCIMVAIVMSGGVFLVEHTQNTEQFLDFFSAVYFSVITLSTVGYGDKAPITQVGRLLAGSGALLGIALFTLPSSIITSGFEERTSRTEGRQRDGLMKLHIVQRRWELRQALAWWAYRSHRSKEIELGRMRREAERLFKVQQRTGLDAFAMEDEEDSEGVNTWGSGSVDMRRGGGASAARSSVATVFGGGGGGSPRHRGSRSSVATSMASLSSSMPGSGAAQTEEEQIQAIMLHLQPQRSATEERRLAKAAQLIEACNGDVGECLMILSEVMSGAAAAALQVGDARGGTSGESLKLQK